MMKPIRVLLVEDHTLVRAGIRALLQQITGVTVVGEASDGREGLALVRAHKPDIVLLDIAMSGLNGLETLSYLTHELPEVRVIMLSVYAHEEYIWQALRAGAKGYLMKDARPTELELALEAVMAGETYLSPAISSHVISYIQRVGEGSSELDRLTPRQREILQLIAEGNTTQEIAKILSLSPKTVDTHRSQLMERLDIHDIAGLVRYAIRIGLISPD